MYRDKGVLEAMVRLFQFKNEREHGDLAIKKRTSSSIVEVYYIPPRLRLAVCGIDPDEASKHQTKLIELDTESGRFTIFPINTVGSGEKFLMPKYKQVRKITLLDGKPVISVSGGDGESDWGYARSITFGPTQPLDEDIDESVISSVPNQEDQIVAILEKLPAAFTKDYDFGLGLARPYRFIVEAVEELTDCTEIVISREVSTREDAATGTFFIEMSDFDVVRKMLNSTQTWDRLQDKKLRRQILTTSLQKFLTGRRLQLAWGVID